MSEMKSAPQKNSEIDMLKSIVAGSEAKLGYLLYRWRPSWKMASRKCCHHFKR
jgi:hypothetical protein